MYARYCRVYYNKSGNSKKAWSIDQGPHTAETLVSHVNIRGVDLNTIYIHGDVKQDEPRGFIEMNNVNIEVLDTRAFITPAAALGGCGDGVPPPVRPAAKQETYNL